MPYVGFHPDLDPGMKRARKGGRRMRGQAIEIIPEHSMEWRLEHPLGELHAHGRKLIGLWSPGQNRDDELPHRVVAFGHTSELPLVIYYLTDWPKKPRHWPSLSPFHLTESKWKRRLFG